MNAQATHGTPQQPLDAMLPACQAALAAGVPEAEGLVARGWAVLADFQMSHDQDPLPAIERAISVAQRVLKRDPTDARALGTIGYALDNRASLESSRGQDPRASIDAGAEAYRRAIALNASANELNNLVALEVLRAEYELDHGIDPEATLRAATPVLEQGLAREPDLFLLHANYGLLYKVRALYEVAHGKDPHASTEIEIEHLRRSLSINPTTPRMHREIGFAFFLRARHALERGGDPSADVERGIAEERAANQLVSNVPTAYRIIAGLLGVRAAWQIGHAEDASATLDEARRQFDQARRVDPADPETDRDEAELALVKARMTRGSALVALLERAASGAAKALQQNRNDTEALVTLADLRRTQAESDRGADARARLKDGLSLVTHALEINSSLASAHLVRSRLLAALASRSPGDETLRTDADAAFARAQLLNPLLTRDALP
jgi:tetratricopeptide (TPR) repeat protein